MGNEERISTISLHLVSENPDVPMPCRAEALGPLLQGFLMETVDTDYAAYLHASAFNPYSMHCVPDGGAGIVWRLNALTGEAARRLIEPLSAVAHIRLRAIDRTFSVEKAVIETVPVASLLKLLSSEADSRHKMRLLTPTAFKSQGEYVNMPSTRLVFQNLFMHYNQIYAGSNEVDEETIAYIAGHSKISSYNLRSRYFPQSASGKARIPAFVGEMTISVSGPPPLRGLANMLLEFGTYAGLGIKTSMGMGGMARLQNVRPTGVSGNGNEGKEVRIGAEE